MKETTREIVSPEENSSAVIEKYKKDGWNYMGAGLALVVRFEREIPDPSTPLQLRSGQALGASPPTEKQTGDECPVCGQKIFAKLEGHKRRVHTIIP